MESITATTGQSGIGLTNRILKGVTAPCGLPTAAVNGEPSEQIIPLRSCGPEKPSQ
ncbi:MAG: hypothetical protein WAM60_09065 [Candidatus Promineifilaceae bacterium]